VSEDLDFTPQQPSPEESSGQKQQNQHVDKPMNSISISKDASAQSEEEKNRIVKTPTITVPHRGSLAHNTITVFTDAGALTSCKYC
jgi:hypothetical protein